MSQLALISNNKIIQQISPGNWLTLPNGDRVSPTYAGWSNGIYHLAAIQEADPIPKGKQVSSTSVKIVGGVPTYVHVLEDIPPESITPDPVSARQLRLSLLQNGITSQDVIDMINLIEDPMQREAAHIEFEYAVQFERHNPLLLQIANALELTEATVDDWWETALEL